MKKPKITDRTIELPFSWHMSVTDNNFTLMVMATVHGFVRVTTWVSRLRPQGDSTELQFIHGGTMHIREIHGQCYSERYCITLARRFAQEIVDKEQAQ